MCLYVPDLETRATEELRFTGSLCALMILVKLFRFDRREGGMYQVKIESAFIVLLFGAN